MEFALTVASSVSSRTVPTTYEGSDRLQRLNAAANKEGPLTPYTAFAEKDLSDPGPSQEQV